MLAFSPVLYPNLTLLRNGQSKEDSSIKSQLVSSMAEQRAMKVLQNCKNREIIKFISKKESLLSFSKKGRKEKKSFTLSYRCTEVHLYIQSKPFQIWCVPKKLSYFRKCWMTQIQLMQLQILDIVESLEFQELALL